jgi:serine kinase of HPr protein (carbohydrate metabolism regulator)
LPQEQAAPPNLHATALLVGDRGVLITAPSGSGKTTLALTLIGLENAAGRFACLVADDQVFAAARAGRLVVSCPRAIAGAVEVFGLGPRPVAHLGSAVVDLVVRLVEGAERPRYADPQTEAIAGVALPRLDLPARNATASALAIAAWLIKPPFA